MGGLPAEQELQVSGLHDTTVAPSSLYRGGVFWLRQLSTGVALVSISMR